MKRVPAAGVSLQELQEKKEPKLSYNQGDQKLQERRQERRPETTREKETVSHTHGNTRANPRPWVLWTHPFRPLSAMP